MAGRGRGRGKGMSFNVEALGFGRGEALPGSIIQPPPLFPVSWIHLLEIKHLYSVNKKFKEIKCVL